MSIEIKKEYIQKKGRRVRGRGTGDQRGEIKGGVWGLGTGDRWAGNRTVLF